VNVCVCVCVCGCLHVFDRNVVFARAFFSEGRSSSGISYIKGLLAEQQEITLQRAQPSGATVRLGSNGSDTAYKVFSLPAREELGVEAASPQPKGHVPHLVQFGPHFPKRLSSAQAVSGQPHKQPHKSQTALTYFRPFRVFDQGARRAHQERETR